MQLLRPAGLLATVAVAAACVAGCSSGSTDDGGGGAAASCAYRVEFDGSTYVGTSDLAGRAGSPQADGRLGEAVLPECDDTGGDDQVALEEQVASAYRITGVPPRWAVAFGQTPGEARIVVSLDGDLPPAVRARLDGDDGPAS